MSIYRQSICHIDTSNRASLTSTLHPHTFIQELNKPSHLSPYKHLDFSAPAPPGSLHSSPSSVAFQSVKVKSVNLEFRLCILYLNDSVLSIRLKDFKEA